MLKVGRMDELNFRVEVCDSASVQGYHLCAASNSLHIRFQNPVGNLFLFFIFG